LGLDPAETLSRRKRDNQAFFRSRNLVPSMRIAVNGCGRIGVPRREEAVRKEKIVEHEEVLS
jgi:hypothetical protein